MDAIAEALATAVEAGAQLGQERVHTHHRVGHYIRAGDFVVGEIDGGLDMGEGAQDFVAPAVQAARQAALQLPLGLRPLRFRVGGDQVGEGFRLGKVELAGEECAAGKFARFSRAQTGQGGKRVQHRGNDSATAVHVKFRDVFARSAGGSGKPQDQAMVEDGTAAGDRGEFGTTWFRHVGERGKGRARIATGYTDHGDPGGALAGTGRKDRGAVSDGGAGAGGYLCAAAAPGGISRRSTRPPPTTWRARISSTSSLVRHVYQTPSG